MGRQQGLASATNFTMQVFARQKVGGQKGLCRSVESVLGLGVELVPDGPFAPQCGLLNALLAK